MDIPEAVEIIERLKQIDISIGDNTKAVHRSRKWLWFQGSTLALVVALGGLGWWDDRQDDHREDAARQHEAEVQAEEDKQDCLDGIEAREDNRQRLLEIAREINSQRLTDIINSSYEGSPPPTACN